MIKESYKLLFVDARKNYKTLLGDMPERVVVLKEPKEFVYVIQVFVNSKKGVEQQLVKLKGILNPKGILWVTYHKGTSKVKTDISRDAIREYADAVGLQAVTMHGFDK